jgi:hypothetical protein
MVIIHIRSISELMEINSRATFRVEKLSMPQINGSLFDSIVERVIFSRRVEEQLLSEDLRPH